MSSLNDTFEVCTWYRDHWTEDRRILRTATAQFNPGRVDPANGKRR